MEMLMETPPDPAHGQPDAVPARSRAHLQHLGRRPYEEVRQIQQVWLDARLSGRCPDTLLLLEHDPVFTIGRRTRDEHWRTHLTAIADAGIPIHHTDRGGSVTYHGPGQLIGYPIMRLRPPFCGPRRYVHLLEETLLRTIAEFGIAPFRREGLHGVWVPGVEAPMKIAAVGVRIVHGVTLHGFSLNVCPDLVPFDWIVPCGIEGCRSTSLASLLDRSVSCDIVAEGLARHFAAVFGLTWYSDVALSPDPPH
ncbi:octanoyltransferase [Nitrospira sp.]|nr:octanoyltransferase [Nitrospira sp.]